MHFTSYHRPPKSKENVQFGMDVFFFFQNEWHRIWLLLEEELKKLRLLQPLNCKHSSIFSPGLFHIIIDRKKWKYLIWRKLSAQIQFTVHHFRHQSLLYNSTKYQYIHIQYTTQYKVVSRYLHSCSLVFATFP